MSEKKQWLLRIVWVCFGVSLAGCQLSTTSLPGDSAENSDLASAPNSDVVASVQASFPAVDLETEVVATHPWTIAFVIKEERYEESPADAFWPVMWRGAEQAGKEFGVNVELAYVAESCSSESQCAEEQIKLVLNRLESGNMNGMIISAKDADRLVPITEKVIESGVPVIAIDSIVNTNKILSFVTIDNYEAGKMMGEWLVGKLDENSNVLILEGAVDQQNAIDRRNGFFAGLQSGNVNILDSKSANWYQDIAAEITDDWLQEFSDVDAILAANDDMALGALTAMQKAGRDDLVVTGYDAIGGAISSIRSGDLAATVDQVPDLQARAAVQLMVRHLETGESFPPRVFIPDVKLVTQGNIEDYIQERQ